MSSPNEPPDEAGAAAQPAGTVLVAETAETECPYCFGSVVAAARKCRHCGEFLDDQLRDARSTGSAAVTSRGTTGSESDPSVVVKVERRKLTEIQKLLVGVIVFAAFGTIGRGATSLWTVLLVFSGLGLADSLLRTRRKPDRPDSVVRDVLTGVLLIAAVVGVGLFDVFISQPEDIGEQPYDCVGGVEDYDCITTDYP